MAHKMATTRGTKINLATADPEWLQLVRDAMALRDYDQARLARAVKISEATVSRLFGKRAECTDGTARKVASVLHIRLPLVLELGSDTAAREWATVGAFLRSRDRATFDRLLAALKKRTGAAAEIDAIISDDELHPRASEGRLPTVALPEPSRAPASRERQPSPPSIPIIYTRK